MGRSILLYKARELGTHDADISCLSPVYLRYLDPRTQSARANATSRALQPHFDRTNCFVGCVWSCLTTGSVCTSMPPREHYMTRAAAGFARLRIYMM